MKLSRLIFGSTIGTIIGVMIGGGLLTFIIIGIISAASGDKDVEVKDDSILTINLSGAIKEKGGTPYEFDAPFMGNQNKMGLYELRKGIRMAKDDDRIKGIYINIKGLSGGWATLEALRKELENFKESDKFIYAYGETYTEGAYYLASVADKVWLYPHGDLELNGFASTPYFVKGAFEKLGVEAKVFRVGTFKSAVEPFINSEMSPANELQIQTLLGDFWDQFAAKIAAQRNLDVDKINALTNAYSIRDAEDAFEAGLVDGLKFEDEVLEMLASETGKKKSDELEFITLKSYSKAADPNPKKTDRKKKISVIFAEGNIVDGKGDDDEVGSATIAPLIRKAREDSTVKAVVLRVNSPGGSALASDVMWREVILTKKVKPVIVSMGDLAASGGYYISAAADRIFAEPNTITGSIGVFGLMFNTEKMFKDKLGVTFDRVATNPYADLGNPNRPMAEDEANIIQSGVNKIYSQFIEVVRAGRSAHFADSAAVDMIAQGRVWSGKRALEIGLVDELGGLDDAIAYAATTAGLGDDYQIRTYPKEKDPIEELMKNLGGASVEQSELVQTYREELEMYKKVKSLTRQQGILMLMPMELEIR
ncbi:MAG: signal peptide peptidase SppA [Bacteroidia bacterium]|nr:signal peptide peptidase SppA [Bacteroidia bacterium]